MVEPLPRWLLACCMAAALPACDDAPPRGSMPAPESEAGSAFAPEREPAPAPERAAVEAPPADLQPPEPAPPGFQPWFADEAAARGLQFVHVSGHDEAWLMPEIMGGGGALLDADDDGALDAYLVQSGWLVPRPGQEPPPNQLFLNAGDGRFRDATDASGAGDRGYGMGVACGDMDADGDVDLFVTNVGPDVLLANDGGGRFRDVTAAAGVGDPGFGASAAFADLDADGRLDLFVTNYLAWSVAGELNCHNDMGGRDYCDPANYAAPARSTLYRNLGGGRFLDVSDSSGVGSVPGTGLGVLCADLDADGRGDVFVANDGMPGRLWRNLGGLRFEERGMLAGCALDQSGKAKAGMGVAAADVDTDGDLDLLVCNLDQQSDSFFLNDGAGLFSDRTQRFGLALASRRFTRFGVGLADFDQDGALDLFQANGRVRRQWRRWADDPYAEPNLLQAGEAGGRFRTLPSLDGTAQPVARTSRGAALGDIDGDGALDVLVVNRDGPAQLLHNLVGERQRAAGTGHAVRFDVREASGGPALGATLTLGAGERRLRADVRAASSYLSSHDPRVHVGLGAVDRATDVRVRWVDGVEERFGDFAADALHVLRRGQGAR